MGLDNPIHLAFVLVLVLLVFGAKRLPEMGRSLGEGMRGFKEAINPQAAAAPLTAISASTPASADSATTSATAAHHDPSAELVLSAGAAPAAPTVHPVRAA